MNTLRISVVLVSLACAVLWALPGSAQTVTVSVSGTDGKPAYAAAAGVSVSSTATGSAGTTVKTTFTLSVSAGVTVTTVNGVSTVTWKDKAVWTGKTANSVRAQAQTVDGVEYAAAWDGTRVIWENVPGAAEKVK